MLRKARARVGPEFYDCGTCDPGRQVLLGHDGPPMGLWRSNMITGAPLRECPIRTMLRTREADPRLSREIERMRLEYFPLFRQGHLLAAGGVAAQPARYLEYMRELSAADELFQLRLRPSNDDADGGDAP